MRFNLCGVFKFWHRANGIQEVVKGYQFLGAKPKKGRAETRPLLSCLMVFPKHQS